MISSIAVEQREREAKALRSSLALYLIGSIVLHGVALMFGVNTPYKALTPEDEPIEFVLVDSPEPQEVSKPEPQEDIEPQTQPQAETQSVTPPPAPVAAKEPASSEPPPIQPVETKPAPKVVEQLKPVETAPEKVTEENVTETKPEITKTSKPLENVKPSTSSSPAPAPVAPPTNQAPANSQATATTKADESPETGPNSLLEGQDRVPVRQVPVKPGTVGGSSSRPTTATAPNSVGKSGTAAGADSRPSTATGTSNTRRTDGGDSDSGSASSGGGRTRASINKEGSDINLNGLKQKVTAVVKDGKIVDFKFKSTGDPELDKAIRKDLAKAKKKFKLPASAKKDGEVRANITFEDKGSKRSRRVQDYIERQARERQAPRAATQPRQRTSSVVQRGVDVAPAPRTPKPATQTSAPSTTQKTAPKRSAPATSTKPAPQTVTPVRRTPVKRAPSVSTPVQRTPTRQRPATKPVRQAPAPVAPARRAPVTSTPVRRTPAPVAPVRRVPATSTPVRRAPSVPVPVKQAPAPTVPPSTSESE